MKIKFTYNKKENDKCWKRYNDFIEKNKTVWGVTKNIKPIIEVKKAELEMDVTDIFKEYEKVFKITVDVSGFIVTTPFSMINDDGSLEKDGIIYYSIYTANPSVVIAHELFHIYFEKYTKREIPNYDEAKEYFTVIINDIFKNDVSKGYPAHQEERKKILDIWNKNRSIDECINFFKGI